MGWTRAGWTRVGLRRSIQTRWRAALLHTDSGKALGVPCQTFLARDLYAPRRLSVSTRIYSRWEKLAERAKPNSGYALVEQAQGAVQYEGHVHSGASWASRAGCAVEDRRLVSAPVWARL